MKKRWAAPLRVSALFAFAAATAVAQGDQSSRDPRTGSELKQNYPNPFGEDTRIAFTLGGYPDCVDPSRQYRVSLRIYNVLAQQVAVPVLQDGASGVSGGQALENVFLVCGDYVAYWNGRVRGTDREAATGIYSYRLEVNGAPVTRKMTVRR